MDKIKLELIERSDEIKRLLDILPKLEEICKKYDLSKDPPTVRVTRKSSESNFIRSFRKEDKK